MTPCGTRSTNSGQSENNLFNFVEEIATLLAWEINLLFYYGICEKKISTTMIKFCNKHYHSSWGKKSNKLASIISLLFYHIFLFFLKYNTVKFLRDSCPIEIKSGKTCDYDVSMSQSGAEQLLVGSLRGTLTIITQMGPSQLKCMMWIVIEELLSFYYYHMLSSHNQQF